MDHHEYVPEYLRHLQDTPAIQAHKRCANHKREIEKSAFCGCFYCCIVYPPASIVEWVDDGKTAICPECGIDSVVGDASGFPVGDKAFLTEMNGLWFNAPNP